MPLAKINWKLYTEPAHPAPRVSDTELRKLYYIDGMTLAAIGIKFGVTRERVRQWMEREGLARRDSGAHIQKIPRELWPQVCRDIQAAGWGGVTRVAHKWNVSRGAIERILRKSGTIAQRYKLPRKYWTEVCKDYLRLGSSIKTGRIWGICGTTVRNILINMGIPRNPKG